MKYADTTDPQRDLTLNKTSKSFLVRSKIDDEKILNIMQQTKRLIRHSNRYKSYLKLDIGQKEEEDKELDNIEKAKTKPNDPYSVFYGVESNFLRSINKLPNFSHICYANAINKKQNSYLQIDDFNSNSQAELSKVKCTIKKIKTSDRDIRSAIPSSRNLTSVRRPFNGSKIANSCVVPKIADNIDCLKDIKDVNIYSTQINFNEDSTNNYLKNILTFINQDYNELPFLDFKTYFKPRALQEEFIRERVLELQDKLRSSALGVNLLDQSLGKNFGISLTLHSIEVEFKDMESKRVVLVMLPYVLIPVFYYYSEKDILMFLSCVVSSDSDLRDFRLDFADYGRLYPYMQGNQGTNRKEISYLWISNRKLCEVKVKYPRVTVNINDKVYEMSIEYNLMIYLMKTNYQNWDFNVLCSLVALKQFREGLLGGFSKSVKNKKKQFITLSCNNDKRIQDCSKKEDLTRYDFIYTSAKSKNHFFSFLPFSINGKFCDQEYSVDLTIKESMLVYIIAELMPVSKVLLKLISTKPLHRKNHLTDKSIRSSVQKSPPIMSTAVKFDFSKLSKMEKSFFVFLSQNEDFSYKKSSNDVGKALDRRLDEANSQIFDSLEKRLRANLTSKEELQVVYPAFEVSLITNDGVHIEKRGISKEEEVVMLFRNLLEGNLNLALFKSRDLLGFDPHGDFPIILSPTIKNINKKSIELFNAITSSPRKQDKNQNFTRDNRRMVTSMQKSIDLKALKNQGTLINKKSSSPFRIGKKSSSIILNNCPDYNI